MAAAGIASAMRWVSVACFVGAFGLLVAALPLDSLMNALRGWIEGLGFWAPLAYALAYGLAATLFVPGSALSLAAGVLFGVGFGTVVVWLGATLAITLSFLIARYAARAKVETIAAERPRFAAVDRAIGEQGWKIVALMRLSPVFPFSLQNYLFGVTAIRFWPCWIASTTCILPGTFLYVYLGYAGGEAAAAVGGSGQADTLKLGLQIAGLLATLAVTVIVARIAARAIARHAPDAEAAPAPAEDREPEPAASPVRTFAVLALAIACLAAAGAAFGQREALRDYLRVRPQVKLTERYAGVQGSARVDHSAFDALLSEHVGTDGLVDYAGLQRDGAKLQGYIETLGKAPFDALGRDGKLALLINAYNAYTLQLIVERYPLDSIRSIPLSQRWGTDRWMVAGGNYSLDDIEHRLIRPAFREERIHFALVCASLGCPALRREAYKAETLEQQLASQAQRTHDDPRWFRFDEPAGEVWLTQIYQWYGGDFEQMHDTVLESVALYSPPLKAALSEGRPLRIRWLPYDWALNERPPEGAS